MKAEELRIGNFLNYTGRTVYVLGIHQARTLGKSHTLDLGYYTDSVGFERHEMDVDLKPIPLSPEWLIRLGFKSNSTAEKYLDAIVFDHEHKSFRLIRYLGGTHSFHLELSGGARRYVREVHDLQNLFYIIEGEELTLKQ